jgi:hypothetical protein
MERLVNVANKVEKRRYRIAALWIILGNGINWSLSLFFGAGEGFSF